MAYQLLLIFVRTLSSLFINNEFAKAFRLLFDNRAVAVLNFQPTGFDAQIGLRKLDFDVVVAEFFPDCKVQRTDKSGFRAGSKKRNVRFCSLPPAYLPLLRNNIFNTRRLTTSLFVLPARLCQSERQWRWKRQHPASKYALLRVAKYSLLF